MKKLVSISFAALWIVGCTDAEALCQHQYDCRDELGVQYEDDYVEVCKAQHKGRDEFLKQSAEKECADLADAEAQYNTCIGTLDCPALADEITTPGTAEQCQTLQENYVKALGDADFGAACDGIDDDVAGEGEGEGEADAGG